MNTEGLKNYEVTYTGTFTVLVKGAPSKEVALEWAGEEEFMGDYEVNRTEVREITDEDDLECSARHANAISEESE